MELGALLAAQAPGCGLGNRKWGDARIQSSFDRKKNKRPARMPLFGGISSDSVRVEPLIAYAAGGCEVETIVADRKRFGAYKVLAGMPQPLGATATERGVNFAVYSGDASAATLCIFTLSDLKKNSVTEEIPLDQLINKTGSIWHIFLEGTFFRDVVYGYKFDGKFSPQEGLYFDNYRVLLDPYAKTVISRSEYGIVGRDGGCWPEMVGQVPLYDSEFDWEGDLPLCYPQKDLIIYEMHIRGYTKHDSSKVDFPGTYIGIVQKLDHLKRE